MKQLHDLAEHDFKPDWKKKKFSHKSKRSNVMLIVISSQWLCYPFAWHPIKISDKISSYDDKPEA